MWLTLATFVGYAVVYTVLLKPATPQNIVIGGASGAMPPVLGWAAVTGDVAPEALLLFLIIFVWTPPHFWSLALYRAKDYASAGLPMLPVTHGSRIHAAADRALHARAVRGDAAAVRDPDERMALPRRGDRAGRGIPRLRDRLYRRYSDALARATFRYSIFYLAALFSRAAARPLLALMRGLHRQNRPGRIGICADSSGARGCSPGGTASSRASDITGAGVRPRLQL